MGLLYLLFLLAAVWSSIENIFDFWVGLGLLADP
jgi:hypothetical protein